MPNLDLVHGGAPASSGEHLEIALSNDDGEQLLPLSEAWSVPFEACRPVRGFPSYKAQRHYPGRWWTATTGSLVGYESWLERDTLVLLDFDPDVVGIASQPFWLFWTTAEGKRRSHDPDYFARLADGSARVLDCRHASRIEPRDQAAFDQTRAACELVGWHYEIADTPDEVPLANARWLAGYRHPRHDLPMVTPALREVFSTPSELIAGAEMVGDRIAVLPVLFHLLWRGVLHADLTRPLAPDTVVGPAVAARR